MIDCPDPTKGRTTLDGVCRNGIQLRARAKVTVRTKLDRLIGGATEETIIARVGEGIVKAIGSAEHHTDVLANPSMISEAVLDNALDAQTAFEIVSIDIAEIDVGQNIGANLQADQAAADLRVAQANAEKRRALAVALEQEMRAKVEENRACVVLAEAEVPKAISQAFRDGKLGVMDYYNMRNLQSDTQIARHRGRQQRRTAGAELRYDRTRMRRTRRMKMNKTNSLDELVLSVFMSASSARSASYLDARSNAALSPSFHWARL